MSNCTAVLMGLAAAGGAVIAPYAVPAAAGVMGFGSGGVITGSVAAGVQSAYYGGAVSAGSWFAAMQSIGAGGLSTLGTMAASAVGASAATVTACISELLAK